MTIVRTCMGRAYSCLAIVAVGGFLSLFSQAEQPQDVVERFVGLFIRQDAEGILKVIDPDVVSGKEIRLSDVEAFLKRCHSNTLKLERFTVDRRFKSEDGSTERFQATIMFRGPSLGERYPGPATLKLVLIWVQEDGTWLLERPLEMGFSVTSEVKYPTQDQQELGMRFEATANVLRAIGVPGTEDLPLIDLTTGGPATSEFKQLEKLHKREKSPKGIAADSDGVQVLLSAARRRPAGLGELYHGDFNNGPTDRRRPVPWDVLRDYASAAGEYGKTLEKRGNRKGAERVYRSLIALGRQFFDEAGGVQSSLWGLTFQKYGAEGLVRVIAAGTEGRDMAQNLASLASRRLDLLQTALHCLDDLADYNSLKASIMAAQGLGGPLFRPWGINTLAILGVKGAPAERSVAQRVGGMVLVLNPTMQRTALDALESRHVTSDEEISSFAKSQIRWVSTHQVYGTAQAFR